MGFYPSRGPDAPFALGQSYHSTGASPESIYNIHQRMAHNFYITITGQKQGAIKGDVTLKGHEGAILGLALSHEIVSPRDPQSGLPSGKRMHKPMKITTPVGLGHAEVAQFPLHQ